MMAADLLVQTVLARPLGKWVKQQADEAGLSTAAWLRKLIMQKQSELWVRAWSLPPNRTVREARVSVHAMWLERVAVHANDSIEFRVYERAGGLPLLAKKVAEGGEYPDLRAELEGRLLLDGSDDLWSVVYQLADQNAEGQLVLFLRSRKAPMATYFAYANPNVRLVGLTTRDPPLTGGTIFWELQTGEVDHNRRIAIVEKEAPPFRLENGDGQTIGGPFPASTSGLEEALMYAKALAQQSPSAPMRLVGGANAVISRWPQT